MVDNKNADIANVRDSSPTANNGSASKQPQIITETSPYTFKQALDKQMARGNPKNLIHGAGLMQHEHKRAQR